MGADRFHSIKQAIDGSPRNDYTAELHLQVITPADCPASSTFRIRKDVLLRDRDAANAPLLNRDFLDLIERNLIAPAIIQLRRPR